MACEKCENGYIYIEEEAKKCECLKAFQKKVKFNMLLGRSGLSVGDKRPFEEYSGEKSAENIKNLIKFLVDYPNGFRKEASFYLWSSLNGTQKTTIAKNILITLLEKGYSGKFILFGEFVNLLLSKERDEEARKEVEFLQKCDVLVLDDCFMKSKVTIFNSGYQFSFIDQFLRKRLEIDKKNTIFTSNVPIEKIESEGFTKDVQSLLHRLISVRGGEMSFDDRLRFAIKNMFDGE